MRRFDRYRTAGPLWTREEAAIARTAKAAVLRMAVAMARRHRGWTLALLGQTTIGKTMLMRLLYCLAMALPRSRYRDGREPPADFGWIDWPDHTWQQVQEHYRTRFLVLDEIGRGNRANRGEDTDRLLTLLSAREANGLYTGITCNLSFDELCQRERALAERLRRNGSVCIQALADVRPFTQRNEPVRPRKAGE